MILFYKLTISLIIFTAWGAQSKSKSEEERFDFRHNKELKKLEPFKQSPTVYIPPSTTTTTTTTRPTLPPRRKPVENPIPNYCANDNLVLKFSNVGLQRIGQDFINSRSVVILSLDNNQINDISPFAFRSIRNLYHLNLSGNKIPRQNLLMLAGVSKLHILVIDDNDSGDNTDGSLKEYEIFKSLHRLHLSNNHLGNFQIAFHHATPVLTHLYLSNNSISSSNTIFDNIPTSLTHIYLNNNLIEDVKHEKLRHLQEFIMDNNIITQVCYDNCNSRSISLQGAVRMHNLSLSRNLITEVTSNAFIDVKRLVNLDLSGNKISDLASDTFNHTTLIINLSIADNILVTIPNVCPIIYLKSLNLTGNRISAVLANSFCNSRSLENLYMSNNIITTIETRAFTNLQNLKYLDLSGNRLRQLPSNWVSPWSLQVLHVERNNFTKIDDLTLANVKSLKDVYVDQNPIESMKVEHMHLLQTHLTIHLKIKYLGNGCNQCDNDNDNDDDDENEDDFEDDNNINDNFA